jgi:glycosyltransferase involved in cell wall biosynthesis
MSRSAPLVAVVTPVYNGAQYLAETMDCVQAQTHPNLVHVVLDNASTDGTAEIIDRYREGRVPLVTARNPKTLPLQENWSAAVALVPAEAVYLRILCADDTMAPDAVALMADVAERHPGVGVVGCGHERNGRVDDDRWPEGREAFPGREALRRILLGEAMIIATHTLLRRSVLDASAAPFQAGLAASDTQMVLRLLTRSDWGFVHRLLATTRLHEESQTSAILSPTEIQFYDWLMLLKELGPHAFSAKDLPVVMQRFRRHYARRMLRWKLAGRADVHARHSAALAAIGEPPSIWGDADAILDWAACKLGVRARWSGYPF